MHISKQYPDMFNYVGLFSAAIMPNKDVKSPIYDNLDAKLKIQFDKKPALYWIAIGNKDFLYQANTDYRKMLERSDIQAVDVCLHNRFHRPMAEAVLEAGKHCYCEKPMSWTYNDAKAMYDTAQRTGNKLHIQLGTIYSPEARAARKIGRASCRERVYDDV